MNKPSAIIFFGFLAVIMGIGKSENEFIPSELKLITGILLLVYGIYLIYKPATLNPKVDGQQKKQTKKGRSYIYLAFGVLLLKSTDFIDPSNPYELSFIKILLYAFGFGFVIFGLNLFFKEKRDQRGSGSIE